MDGLGRLVRVEEASGTAIAAATDYGYDAADRLVSVSQGDRPRSFEYLLSGWLKEARNPESGLTGNGVTQYEYTDAGRLVKKTSPAGRVCRKWSARRWRGSRPLPAPRRECRPWQNGCG